ncbi:MAG: glycosyltransferase [Thermoleophilaceae bacterium]
MPGSPDIALVSLGTTFGWRRGDEALAAHVRAAGATCRVVGVPLGHAAVLRRSMATTDLVEALAARNSARGLEAGAVIYSTITAALLQPSRHPSAVRFDGIAAVNRPGLGGAWQRRREPSVLSRADLLLPMSEPAAEQARQALAAVGLPRPDTMVLAPPVEAAEPSAGGPDALAYAANPDKRGLDLLCEAWALAATSGARLAIGGIDREQGLRWLERCGVPEPAGVQWLGAVERERWLSLVASARAFVSAARIEDWGLAQMEALAAGTPLVCAPSPGAYAALPLARELDPSLVAAERSAPALGQALDAALALDAAQREDYAARARVLLRPYEEGEVRRRVAEDLLPRLLNSSS